MGLEYQMERRVIQISTKDTENMYSVENDPNFFKLTSFSRKSIKLSELFLKDKRS